MRVQHLGLGLGLLVTVGLLYLWLEVRELKSMEEKSKNAKAKSLDDLLKAQRADSAEASNTLHGIEQRLGQFLQISASMDQMKHSLAPLEQVTKSCVSCHGNLGGLLLKIIHPNMRTSTQTDLLQPRDAIPANF